MLKGNIAFFGTQQALVGRQVCDAGFFQPVFPWFEQRGERNVGIMAMIQHYSGECAVWRIGSLHRRIFSVVMLTLLH